MHAISQTALRDVNMLLGPANIKNNFKIQTTLSSQTSTSTPIIYALFMQLATFIPFPISLYGTYHYLLDMNATERNVRV